MTTSRDKLRALALAGLMVLSVVAMGVSIAGTAAADHGTDTITVDDDGANFTTIQAAINHANESDTIVVENGTYDGFVVNESVSVEAAEGATPIVTSDGVALEGSNRNVAVYIAADGVLVEGFELNGAAGTAKRGFGVDTVDELDLQDNLVHNFTTGASLQFSGPAPTDVRIEGNEFHDNTAGVGSTEDVTGLTIVENDFIDNDESIGLGSGVGIESIADNEFVGEVEHVRIYDGASSPDLDSILEANGFNRAVSVTDGDAIWTSIQDGVDAANDSDTVTVEAGTYDENVEIDKNVSLVGAGSSQTVISPGSGNAVSIDGHTDAPFDGVTVSGFALDGAFIAQSGTVVEAPDTRNLIVSDVHVDGSLFMLNSVGGAELVEVTIENVPDAGEAGALELTGVADLTIRESEFLNNSRAVRLQPTDGLPGQPDAYGENGPITIRDSSFVDNSESVVNDDGNITIDATENWWGSNAGPSGQDVNGSVDVDPWYEDASLSTLSDEEDDSPSSPPSISTGDDDEEEEEQQETPTPTDDEPPEGDVERQTTKEVADENPDTPGTTVTFDEEESSVNEITFEDEDSGEGGSVTVTEYSEVPEDLQDANGNDVVHAVDISVPEDRRDSPADVTMTLSQAQLGDQDPEDAQVAHRTDDGEWELLETEVVVSEDGAVTLTAETDGFSVFGVAFEQAEEPTATPGGDTPAPATATPVPGTAQPTDEPVEEPAGFDLTTIGLVVALVLVVIGLFALARRRA